MSSLTRNERTEAENLQRALQADYELKLTEEAFDNLRQRYIQRVLDATNPDMAMDMVRSVRILDSVQLSLRQVVTTSKMDQAKDA